MSERQIELESKIAFLEHTLDTLSAVMHEQGRTIEALEKRLGQVESRVRATQEGEVSEGDPLEERPPHY